MPLRSPKGSGYPFLGVPVTGEVESKEGNHSTLRKALRADHEESVWDHLNAENASFEAASDTKNAVKVIAARGNELMVVKTIGEAVR